MNNIQPHSVQMDEGGSVHADKWWRPANSHDHQLHEPEQTQVPGSGQRGHTAATHGLDQRERRGRWGNFILQ